MNDTRTAHRVFGIAAKALFELFEVNLAARAASDWSGGRAVASTTIHLTEAHLRCEIALTESSSWRARPEADRRFIAVDDGATNPTSPSLLTSNVFYHAAALTFWSSGQFERPLFIEVVEETLTEVLHWLGDDSCEVTSCHLVALNNVFLAPGVTIQLPYGELRTPPHHPVMPRTHRLGPLEFTIGLTEWDEAPSAILLRKIPTTGRAVRDADTSLPRRAAEPAEIVAEAVSLAIVLACGHYEHSAPSLAGFQQSQPLTGIGSGSSARVAQRQPGIPVPATVVGEIETYARRIADLDRFSPVRFGGRRLLRALNADLTEDALVDAVVVWEALFSSTTETTFRVTAAVAKTLQREFEDNLPVIEFQGILARIYAARSEIVHGNAVKVEKNSPNHYDLSRNAKRYSRLLLRRALLWSDDILALDAGARSKQAILGVWPPDPGVK